MAIATGDGQTYSDRFDQLSAPFRPENQEQIPIMPAGERPGAKDPVQLTGDKAINEAITSAASKYGLDPNVMRSIASIESGWDAGSNRHRSTQYKGLYQIGRNEWKQYGGGGDIYDAKTNAEAAAHMLADHRDWFKSRYGRDPNPGELYMMHQQGQGFMSSNRITNARGNPYPGMKGRQTHASFAIGWGREVEKRAKQYQASYADEDKDKNLPKPYELPPDKEVPTSQNINREHHVPLAASGILDKDRNMVGLAIDHRVPSNPEYDQFVGLHEKAEIDHMRNLVDGGMQPGEAYREAHDRIATPTETAAVRAHAVRNNMDPDEYLDKYKSFWRDAASVASQPTDRPRHPDAHTTRYGIDESELPGQKYAENDEPHPPLQIDVIGAASHVHSGPGPIARTRVQAEAKGREEIPTYEPDNENYRSWIVQHSKGPGDPGRVENLKDEDLFKDMEVHTLSTPEDFDKFQKEWGAKKKPDLKVIPGGKKDDDEHSENEHPDRIAVRNWMEQNA